MAFRRRRRKARPLWFPPLGANFTIDQVVKTSGGVTFSLDVPGNGDFNFVAIPLTFDAGQEDFLGISSNVQVSLADLMSSAWRCRRIVGKIFATLKIPGESDLDITAGRPLAVWAVAGFMVRNVGPTGNVVSTTVNPNDRDDYDDPWIWRRSWLLGANSTPTAHTNPSNNPASFDVPTKGLNNFTASDLSALTDTDAAFTHFPHTNVHYGSVLDGPHVDAKTNRIIGPEQSLFLHFGVKAVPLSTQYGNGVSLVGLYDLRLLGSLMRATNRRNAAR